MTTVVRALCGIYGSSLSIVGVCCLVLNVVCQEGIRQLLEQSVDLLQTLGTSFLLRVVGAGSLS